jgi:hypothetical protein
MMPEQGIPSMGMVADGINIVVVTTILRRCRRAVGQTNNKLRFC